MNAARLVRTRFSRKLRGKDRRGAFLVLVTVLLVIMIGMVAFALDLGYIANVKTELRRTADASALAGAGELVNGVDEAQSAVLQYVNLNQTGHKALDPNNVQVEFGMWDRDNRVFSVGGEKPAALRVTLTNQQPLFFGRIFGKGSFTTTTSAVATYRPREIMLVLDYSGSMSDDSELQSIGRPGLSKASIEANLAQMYAELGSPVYGTLQFTPQWPTVPGVAPTSSAMPQIHVRFQRTSVYVTSTKTLNRVILQFTNGNRQTFSNLSGYNGTFQGSGTNAGREIEFVWVKSGSNDPDNDGYGEKFDESNNSVLKAFGLNNVPYPYPGGSWSDYISYAKTNNAVNNAGYRKKYGYLTWINYLMERQGSHAATPDLWKCSEQPVTAVKDAVQVFLAYMQEVDTADRVGFTLYTAADGKAIVESPLTHDFDQVEAMVRQRQAGHYHDYTNIGDGLKYGLEELVKHSRPNAMRLIVLMTDGLANLPNNASNYALQQAQAAAEARVPVVTISLGAGADVNIMQQIADITGGVHFNVPGGQAVEDYEEDLKDVFRQVADDRPLQLVE